MDAKEWSSRIIEHLDDQTAAQSEVDRLYIEVVKDEYALKTAEALCLLTALEDSTLTGSNQQTRDAQFMAYLEGEETQVCRDYQSVRLAMRLSREALANAKRRLTGAEHLLRLNHELLRFETARLESWQGAPHTI